MKFKMSENSLFAILLRSHWWISVAIAGVLSLLAWVLLPEAYRIAGALSSFPFIVIAAMSAWRRRDAPSNARIEQTAQAINGMAWPAFADLLEQAFRRDGYTVRRRTGSIVDFELERKGRTMLVSAKRWKSARAGLEPLRELQAARDASEAPDALWIGLGALTDTARPFAAEHRIAVWQLAELAQALRGLPLGPTPRA
ncbi:MAG: restriction endonuclease [Methylibium sp. NZG]|nr:MAG: restriction endonuclease [Methylibium sp. NZG]